MIDSDAANDVLGWAGLGGWTPGGFTTKLLDAIAHADDTNRARLALGFPAHVHAMNVFSRECDGIDRLRMAAKG